MKKKTTAAGRLLVVVLSGLLVNWLTPVDIPGFIWRAVCFLWRFLLTTVPLPLWALLALAFAWPLLGRIAKLFNHSQDSEELPQEMQFLNYTSDSFLDVKWLWSYSGNKINEDTLTARCPKCECLLDWVQESGFRVVDNITLICPSCGYRKEFDRNEHGISRLVYQHIDRMIVTGAYKENGQQAGSTGPSKAATSASSDIR